MGYKESTNTQYKIGDILHGKNAISVKVIAVNANGAVDIQLLASHSGSAYYYFSAPYRTTVRKEPDQWLLMPSNRILRNINVCTQVQFRFLKDTVQTKSCDGHRWWGNLYGSNMFYGEAPYGHYYVPKNISQTVPTKDLSQAEWRKAFGLTSDWNRVPGSYKWSQTGNVGGFYGWTRENNYGPYLNKYAKAFTMKFSKGSKTEVFSDKIIIDKIKLPVKTYQSEQIDGYIYRGNLKPVTEVTYAKITEKGQNTFVKIPPMPAINTFAIPDGGGSDYFNFAWTSTEDSDASKLDYNIVNIKFIDGYTAVKTDYTAEGEALSAELVDLATRLAGRYEIEVRGVFDKKESQFTSERWTIILEDNTIAAEPLITDVYNSDIVYDMKKEINTLPHTPKWTTALNHTYSATYDYYSFEPGGGYDYKLIESGISFANGFKTFKADGQYHIKLTATYRNGKSFQTEAVFVIDTRLPVRPEIYIDGVREDIQMSQIGLNDDDKKTYLNDAKVTIQSPPFTKTHNLIYFKKMRCDTFDLVGVDKLPVGGLFNRLGTWLIISRCEKTEVHYPDGSPLLSEFSEVIYAVKKRYACTLKKKTFILQRDLNTEQIFYEAVLPVNEGHVEGFKVEVDIGFAEALTDVGNLDMRFVLYPNGDNVMKSDGSYKMSLDYTGLDSSLSKLYRIDGSSDWLYYLDKIYLYKNCSIEYKTVDDDNFESAIGTGVISSLNPTKMPKALNLILVTDPNNDNTLGTNIIETGSRIIVSE